MFTNLVNYNYGAPPDTSYFLGNIIGVCLNIEHPLHPLVNHHVLLTSHFFLAYPLVNIQKTMENHHFSWENQLFLWAIFNSYVKLPEGTLFPFISRHTHMHQAPKCTKHKKKTTSPPHWASLGLALPRRRALLWLTTLSRNSIRWWCPLGCWLDYHHPLNTYYKHSNIVCY